MEFVSMFHILNNQSLANKIALVRIGAIPIELSGPKPLIIRILVFKLQESLQTCHLS